MLKRIMTLLLIVCVLSLQSCVSAANGLQSYVDTYDGYEFAYPNGWLPVKVTNGPDVVFRDLVNETENVSVVISPVPEGKTLEDLGTPTEVGYQLSKSITAASDSERNVELLNATAKKTDTETYYILEYGVKLANQARHNLASTVVRRGKLFTFNASTTERRWSKVKELLEIAVNSFSVY
ncbi:MAG: photosystem II oxygen evolving complex protein PsbP [Cyanothece sp. SIO1E1]|nr:photosystem II oxygen evolving complex protein PsbP [Cyanothece sp. SIO1E1]